MTSAVSANEELRVTDRSCILGALDVTRHAQGAAQPPDDTSFLLWHRTQAGFMTGRYGIAIAGVLLLAVLLFALQRIGWFTGVFEGVFVYGFGVLLAGAVLWGLVNFMALGERVGILKPPKSDVVTLFGERATENAEEPGEGAADWIPVPPIQLPKPWANTGVWSGGASRPARRHARPDTEVTVSKNSPRHPARPFASDSNEFAVEAHGRLRERGGNLFFSPFSVRTALSMAYAGARGEVARQMAAALHISPSDETWRADLAELERRLGAAGGGAYEMAVANSLWGQNDAPLQPEFLDLIARYYAGATTLADFRGNADAVRRLLNQWVEEHTRQKIRDLIPPGGVDALTRLVLVNAVYFKGMWQLPFRREATRDEPFYREGGGTVQAPLMRMRASLWYARPGGCQAVELLYSGDDLSLLLVVPDERDGLWEYERLLSAPLLHTCVDSMVRQTVDLLLPRFTITWGTANLTGPLTEMGMRAAFSRGDADFSGINGYKPPAEESLHLSSVFHKAFVELNEEGTEAAAATAVNMVALSAMRPSNPPPIPVIRADHPFLFAIRDRPTGVILFLGRIADPARD